MQRPGLLFVPHLPSPGVEAERDQLSPLLEAHEWHLFYFPTSQEAGAFPVT